jgi:hypothetical protein
MVIQPPREGQQAVRQRCRPAGRALRDCHIFLQLRQEKCAFRRDRSIATSTRSAMTAFGSKATAEISRWQLIFNPDEPLTAAYYVILVAETDSFQWSFRTYNYTGGFNFDSSHPISR